ncbi:MAG: hypothetical protein AAFU60_16860, partial [Bacteroidota bacterium]
LRHDSGSANVVGDVKKWKIFGEGIVAIWISHFFGSLPAFEQLQPGTPIGLSKSTNGRTSQKCRPFNWRWDGFIPNNSLFVSP